MRLPSLLAFAALIGPLASGCFVLDELDASEKLMDEHSPKRNRPVETTSSQAAPASEKGEPGPSERWWSHAQSFTSGERDASIVRCEIGGGTRFMQRTECAIQGGKPAG